MALIRCCGTESEMVLRNWKLEVGVAPVVKVKGRVLNVETKIKGKIIYYIE